MRSTRVTWPNSPRRSSRTPLDLPSESRRHLTTLVARRRQVLQMKVRRQNRVHTARQGQRASLEAHLAWPNDHLETLEAQITAQIEANPVYRGQAAFRETVPGVGTVTVHTLIPEGH